MVSFHNLICKQIKAMIDALNQCYYINVRFFNGGS
jgi:hypothetical protein